ncbi:MAG TPA: hypothetical protein VHE59_10015 [Mucilaginibacter sp.]|nr:hypothetical protein [Mucilaginibacter sp.]
MTKALDTHSQYPKLWLTILLGRPASLVVTVWKNKNETAINPANRLLNNDSFGLLFHLTHETRRRGFASHIKLLTPEISPSGPKTKAKKPNPQTPASVQNDGRNRAKTKRAMLNHRRPFITIWCILFGDSF